MVRILKALRNHMQGDGVSTAKDVASFLIESLVYRVPDSYFGHDESLTMLRALSTFSSAIWLPIRRVQHGPK